MAVVDVDLYTEETDVHVVFHGVEDDEQKSRIKDWVDTLRGVSDSFSKYMFVEDLDQVNDEEDMDYDESVGTQFIIPEGKYKGMTIDDVYNMYGHYSLSELMRSINKMESITPEERKQLYKEVIQYAVPLIRQKETSFEDFIDAYSAFLKDHVPAPGKTLKDWLKLPKEEQRIAYDAMADHIIERMLNSIRDIE